MEKKLAYIRIFYQLLYCAILSYNWSTATTDNRFLDIIQQRTLFPTKVIQVDGGAEFEAIFELEEECQ